MQNFNTEQKKLQSKARSVLSYYYKDASQIELLTSGMYSGVYSFTNDGKKLILKIPGRWFSLDSELFFYQELQSKGIVPKIENFNTQEGWMVVEFIKGFPEWEDLSVESKRKLWKNFGQIARIIHSIPVDGVGAYRNGNFRFKNTKDFLKAELSWLQKEPLFAESLLNTKRIQILEKNIDHFSIGPSFLLHGDLHLFNTLHDENKIFTIIDPGPWRGGDPIFDLGAVHSKSLEYSEGETFLILFEEGYGKKIKWDSNQVQMCSLLRDLVVLRFFAANDSVKFEERLKQKYHFIRQKFDMLGLL